MDLFEGKEPLDLSVPDAELRLFRDVDLGFDDQDLIEHLIAKTNWQAQAIKLWGKAYLQPRLVAWHGDRGCRYTYSGITLEPAPWTDTLLALPAGSLLIMAGNTQRHWKHGIRKESRACGPRVNLTFRQIHPV